MPSESVSLSETGEFDFSAFTPQKLAELISQAEQAKKTKEIADFTNTVDSLRKQIQNLPAVAQSQELLYDELVELLGVKLAVKKEPILVTIEQYVGGLAAADKKKLKDLLKTKRKSKNSGPKVSPSPNLKRGPFSKEENEKIQSMRSGGKNIDEIAAALNRSHGAITKLLAK